MTKLIKLRNTLDLTKGIVCIGDPWYDSASLKLEIKKGNYDCYVKINESTNRVIRMMLMPQDTEIDEMSINAPLNIVTVDSGTMSIRDKWVNSSSIKNDLKFMNERNSSAMLLQEENIFLARTGFGDGMYSVSGYFNNKDVLIAIKIDF